MAGLLNAKTIQENCQKNHLSSPAIPILRSLNGAFKKILLYPPEHLIYQNSLKTLQNHIDNYFSQTDLLELKIDRNTICYQDEIIHEGPMTEENMAFILFRDGIHSLVFRKGMKDWETHAFLEILKKHHILAEDAENDIVTALWEMELPSLYYEADDVGFDTGEDFEIPDLGYYEPIEVPSASNTTHAEDLAVAPPLHIPAVNRSLWELTPKDDEALSGLLVEEEDWERIEYVLYVLLYVLQQQAKPENFSEVMTYLRLELQNALEAQKYKSVYNTLNILKNNLDSPKLKGHWAESIIDDFFATLSGKSFLKVMQDNLEGLETCGQQERGYLKQTLLFLKATAIDSICPMLLMAKSNPLKKLFMEVIGCLAESEYSYFQKQLSSENIELVEILIHIVGFMKSERSFAGLLKLMRHPSASVRKTALKAACHRRPDMIGEWFWLLEDTDEGVQQLYLKCAGKKRDVKIETLFRDYLKKNRLRSGNRERTFWIFKTLGKCGSDKSLPFLRKHLYFLSIFGILRSKKSSHRQAASLALRELKTEMADRLLLKLS